MQTIIFSGGNEDKRRSRVEIITTKLLNRAGMNTDLKIIARDDGKKNISIAQARELISFISIRPVNSKSKVAVIYAGQFLSIEAQNALLKVIEEPPQYAQIIITVDHPSNLLQTIRSRCVVHKLSDVDSSINVEDESFAQIRDEFLALLAGEYGARIDWAVSKKDELKDRDYLHKLLAAWEVILRDLMVLGEKGIPILDSNIYSTESAAKILSTNDPRALAEDIRLLRIIKKNIEKYNANASLGIESFLMNI